MPLVSIIPSASMAFAIVVTSLVGWGFALVGSASVLGASGAFCPWGSGVALGFGADLGSAAAFALGAGTTSASGLATTADAGFAALPVAGA